MARAVPISGTQSGTLVVGPFDPILNKPVFIELSGTWAGTVTLQRSTDLGTTKLPVTSAGSPWGVFSANACEPVWEDSSASALLYLSIVVTSGNLNYKLGH